MLIPINEEFELESNGQCYWINRIVTTKKGPNAGKQYRKGEAYCGYHKTLSDLMDNFLQKRIREADVADLVSLAEAVDEIALDVRACCKQIEKHIKGKKELSELLS